MIAEALHSTPAAPAVEKVCAMFPTVELDPHDVIPAPGNAPVTLATITESGLLSSVEHEGQLVEGVVYPHPDLPAGKYYAADGNGRVLCNLVLGRKFRARVLDHAPTKAELRRIRVATTLIRKNGHAAQAQLAADLVDEMKETGHNLQQAASDLGMTASHASRLLAPVKKLCPALHHLLANKAICWDGKRIIATLPTEDLQKRLAEKVEIALAENGTVKRDVIDRWAKEIRGCKLRKKTLTLKLDGVKVTITDPSVERAAAFGERYMAAVKKLIKDGDGIEYLSSRLKMA